ncbi:Hsp70 family protein [Nocardia sp. NPDC005825]|uniref:Hsp70 family protein n=2 Tax=unclassified Nocardia TaxID=2637762 RepID=UPI0033DBBDD1
MRVRRTAVTFDSAGGPQIGGIPRFAPVVTDFADLTADPDPVVIGGRIWSPADLIAAVVNGLIESHAPEAPAVTTYPACYSDKLVTRIRRALDWSGAADVTLMPEPVAAVEWLDEEYGLSENGITLVYDLGGNSLDLAVVRTESEVEERGILGRAERSYDFGGRPLGALLAKYARSIAPGATQPVSAVVPASDTNRLRSWHIRNSLRLVRSVVHRAGLHMEEIDRVLLIGGAARPPEVARVLADLGRPVVMSPDPAHTAAVGAAIAAFRSVDTGSAIGRYAPRAAVISGAAVASALAMSAATVLGGPVAGPPGLQAAPEPADPPAGTSALGGGDVMVLDDVTAPAGTRSHAVTTVAAVRSYAPQAPTVTSTWYNGRPVDTTGGGSHCETRALTLANPAVTYANPAQFTNPLPFQNPVLAGWTIGGYVGKTPKVSVPGAPSATLPGGTTPGATQPGTGQPGTTQPGTTQPGGTQPGAGQPGGGQPGSGQPGGTTPGGATGGTGGGTGTPGTSTPGGTGGTTTGGTTSGGGASNPGGGTSAGGGATGDPAGANTDGASPGSNGGGSNPGGSNPGGSNPGGSSPGGSNVGGSNPGGSSPGGSNPGGSNPDGSNPGGSSPGGSNAGGSNPGGSNQGGSKPGGATGGVGTGGGAASPGGSKPGGSQGGALGGGSQGGATGGGSPGGASKGGAGGSSTGGSHGGGMGGGAGGGMGGGGMGGGGGKGGGGGGKH